MTNIIINNRTEYPLAFLIFEYRGDLEIEVIEVPAEYECKSITIVNAMGMDEITLGEDDG